jgi:subtilisin family serine protease
MRNTTGRVLACAAGVLIGASSISPALAETPTSSQLEDIPAVLAADLSTLEEHQLAAATSGDGVPLAAFVETPSGPEIVTLDAGSRVDAAAAAALLDAQPSVRAADVSVPVRATAGAFPQYGNTMVRSGSAHAAVDNPLSDVVVAVLDTGVYAHTELAGALLPGQNFTGSPGGALDTTDRYGHGTHVSGTIAADAGSDVEGVAYGVKILPVKVLGDTGGGWDSWAADGILWAADHGADVINMSLSGAGYSSLEASAISYARSKGVTVIAAAGNDNSSALRSPAGLPGVIAVSAVDQSEDKAWFSNYGPSVDLAAPGVSILSTYLDDTVAYMSGTSMASPHVAGVAALVKGAAPGLTPDQVEEALEAGVTDLGAPGRDDVFGYGLVDAPRAVEAANSLEATGTLPPVKPTTAPEPPGIGTATAGNASATVRWTAPVSDGGSPVTGYTVATYRDGVLVKTSPAPAGASTSVVTGLTNGRPHTFTVTATNVVGTSAASPASAPVTPATAVTRPGAPRIGTPVAGVASATVRWAAPLGNGGSPVTGYTVRAYRGASVVAIVRAASNATGATVNGLANGTAYTFLVTATNAVGEGAASARSATVVPRTAPSAPRITGVAAGRSAAAVGWAAPANGGAAITAYVVRVYRGSALIKTVKVSASTTRLTVPGLTPRVGHSFTVYAVNAAGNGYVSGRSATVVPLR